MHVFITGGTGHAGSHIIPELLAGGHEVTALVRSVASAAAVPKIMMMGRGQPRHP
jgi:nucleoside-diphosphate-sugar epimerase